MDWHDQQDLARYRKRKRKQKEYQASYRERLKKAKTPERDDIAAELMRAFLEVVSVDSKSVAMLSRALLNGLEHRGYDRKASAQQVKAMVRRVRARMDAKQSIEET